MCFTDFSCCWNFVQWLTMITVKMFSSASGLVLFITFLLSLVTGAFSQQESCGKYTFLTQPPSEIVCNPYGNVRTTRFECTVVGPNFNVIDSESEFSIKWFRLRSSLMGAGDPEELNNNALYLDNIGVRIQDFWAQVPQLQQLTILRSRLELSSPSNLSEGEYWCQVAVKNPVDNTDMLFDKSNKFNLENPSVYADLDTCTSRTIFLDLTPGRCLLDLVTLGSENSSEQGQEETASTDEAPTRCSSPGSNDGLEGDVVLPMMFVIIIGCVGGVLLLSIIILTICLVGVFIRLRVYRGRRQVEPTVEPKKESKGPKRPAPPVPEKPTVRRTSSTTQILTAPVPETPADSPTRAPNQSNTYLTNPAPKLPVFARDGVRRSLPARSPRAIKLEEHEEEYTPVLSQKDRKASTLIQKLKMAVNKDNILQQANNASNASFDKDVPQHEYRGLNPNMMDDIQPYDSTRSADEYDSTDDDAQSDYTEPNTFIKGTRERPSTLSVDGEYVYPDNVNVKKTLKDLTPTSRQEYMAMYDTPEFDDS